jgi:hypothetical protein
MPDKDVSDGRPAAFPRRVAAMITYLHPFRMIESEALDKWSASIEQVNRHDWEYVKLHEISGGIDVGLPAPYQMLIGRDGALALPPIPELRSDQQAVEFFNRCLAALLLGGVYCAAVTVDNLEFGSIIDWKYIRSHGGQAGANHFHKLVRMRMAPPIDAIRLMNPPTLDFEVLRQAAKEGFALLKSVRTLREFSRLQSGLDPLLKGRGPFEAPHDLEERSSAIWPQEELTISIGLCSVDVVRAVRFDENIKHQSSRGL